MGVGGGCTGVLILHALPPAERETQTDRHRKTDRQTEAQTDRQTEIDRDRQSKREMCTLDFYSLAGKKTLDL